VPKSLNACEEWFNELGLLINESKSIDDVNAARGLVLTLVNVYPVLNMDQDKWRELIDAIIAGAYVVVRLFC